MMIPLMYHRTIPSNYEVLFCSYLMYTSLRVSDSFQQHNCNLANSIGSQHKNNIIELAIDYREV